MKSFEYKSISPADFRVYEARAHQLRAEAAPQRRPRHRVIPEVTNPTPIRLDYAPPTRITRHARHLSRT